MAAAGSGFLSDGVYRGLASEARIVLVKVGRGGRISDAAIEKGLAWVLENQDRHGIRVVSMSLGGDVDRPLGESRVNQLAEECVRRGMVLVAAAGNSGCSAQNRVLPPATAPSVIAVGGYDDGNDPERANLALYCSSFGVTADGLTKPEIIAPAMWVAAPILPGTPAYARAQALAELSATPDNRLAAAIRDIGPETIGLPPGDWPGPDALRAWIDGKLRAEKIVGAHYQHVDGTSFAAPVVASVVAQMLEANPELDAGRDQAHPPADGRARRHPAGDPPGVRAARRPRAVLAAPARVGTRRSPLGRRPARRERPADLPPARRLRASVAVAGDFNRWIPTPLEASDEGSWRLELPAPAAGRYLYKLLLDGAHWSADPGNGTREPDPYGGSNSVLTVKPAAVASIE